MEMNTRKAREFLRVGLVVTRNEQGAITRIDVVHTLNGWWIALLVLVALKALGVSLAEVGALVTKYIAPLTPELVRTGLDIVTKFV